MTNGHMGGRNRRLVAQLTAKQPERRYDALTAIVTLGLSALVDEVLGIFQSDPNSRVRARAAWALGKLRAQNGLPALVQGIRNWHPDVRIWSAWALGEMGFTKQAAPLITALEEEENPRVRRAIGGAIKKLRFQSVRAPTSVVARALKPPPPRHPQSRRIVGELGRLSWPTDRDRIVALRSELSRLAPHYFREYMEWIGRRKAIEQALTDDRHTYD